MIDRSDLEIWVEGEVAYWAGLVTHDDGTLGRYRELALLRGPMRPDALYLPKAHARSAFSDPQMWGLTGDGLEAWQDYADRWHRFVEANPRIRLAHPLKTVSETYDGASWPWGYEERGRVWVQSGCP